METNSNKKILTICFMATGAVVGIIATILFGALTQMSGTAQRLLGNDVVSHVLPVVLGLITFLILQFNPKLIAWGDEVVSEIRKVVWPSRRDTALMTVAVCIMIIISAVVLGIFDVVSSHLVQALVTR